MSFETFHFNRPIWLLGALALPVMLWVFARRGRSAGAWQRVCDPALLPHGRPRGKTFAISMRLADSKVFNGTDPTFAKLDCAADPSSGECCTPRMPPVAR